MERVESDGNLLPAISIHSMATCYYKIELFIDFRRRLATAIDASGVYTALYIYCLMITWVTFI